MTRNVTAADRQAIEDAGRELTDKQKAFVDNLFIPGTGQEEAALKAGYAPKSAAVQATRNLQTDKVKAYIDVCVNKGLKVAAITSLSVVQDLSLHANSPYVRLQAAQDILDRAGYKPVEKSMVGVVGDLNVSIDIG